MKVLLLSFGTVKQNQKLLWGCFKILSTEACPKLLIRHENNYIPAFLPLVLEILLLWLFGKKKNVAFSQWNSVFFKLCYKERSQSTANSAFSFVAQLDLAREPPHYNDGNDCNTKVWTCQSVKTNTGLYWNAWSCCYYLRKMCTLHMLHGTLWCQQIPLSFPCNVLDVWAKLKRNNSNAAKGEFWSSIFWWFSFSLETTF